MDPQVGASIAMPVTALAVSTTSRTDAPLTARKIHSDALAAVE
jgi:hypothetical protein